MNKLLFLAGSWSGRARIWRAPDSYVDLIQTEQVAYKVDGLVLAIEGLGKSETDDRAVLQALGLISYDDEHGVYRMRAFNDGRWLETEVVLDDSGQGLLWGFQMGEIETSSSLRMDENGDWTESHELTVGSQPSRRFMTLTAKRELGQQPTLRNTT